LGTIAHIMAKLFRHKWFRNSLAFTCGSYLRFMSQRLWWVAHRDVPPETQALLDAETPVIFALWHGRMYGLLRGVPEHRSAILISASNDGEFMAAVAKRLGFRDAVRGSSKRGGALAIRNMIRALTEDGTSMALTVDGPRGPRYEVKPGIIKLAAESGVPIIPMGSSAILMQWHFKSAWDHYHAAGVGFNRIKLVYGTPLYVPKDADETQLEAARKQLEESLMAINLKADALDGFKNKERL